MPIRIDLRAVGGQEAQPGWVRWQGESGVDRLVRRPGRVGRRRCGCQATLELAAIEPCRVEQRLRKTREPDRGLSGAPGGLLAEVFDLGKNLLQVEAHDLRGRTGRLAEG